MLTELTDRDRTHLQELRLARLLKKLPALKPATLEYAGQILTVVVDENDIKTAAAIVWNSKRILDIAAIILGTSEFELWRGDTFLYRAELESNQCNRDICDMASATLEANRAIEFNVEESKSSENEPLVQWQVIGNKTGYDEGTIIERCRALNIAFQWMDGKNWGIPLSAAKQILIRLRFEQGQNEAEELSSLVLKESGWMPPSASTETNGSQPKTKTTTADKPKKTGTKRPTPIKLVGEFKPVKDPNETSKRYLEAVAPADMDKQMGIIDAIVSETKEGDKHLEKILSSYNPNAEKPAQFKLRTAFENLGKRRKLEASKTETPTQENSESAD
jgi:hypothetical protein